MQGFFALRHLRSRLRLKSRHTPTTRWKAACHTSTPSPWWVLGASTPPPPHPFSPAAAVNPDELLLQSIAKWEHHSFARDGHLRADQECDSSPPVVDCGHLDDGS